MNRRVPLSLSPLRRPNLNGQASNGGFVTSVISSYANLTQTPHVLFLAFFLILVLLAEINATDGPLESIHRAAQVHKGNTTLPRWETGIISIADKLVAWMIPLKYRLLECGFLILPALAKPSTKNIIVSGAFCLIAIVMRNWSLIETLALSQLWFLFTQLRSPVHKLYICAAGFVVFFVGIEIAYVPVVASKKK